MVKNTDFIGFMDSKPYKFQHYYISDFSFFVNDQQFPNESLFMVMDYEKTPVMDYRTFYEASSTHHSYSGLQITYDMYINGYFVLLFILTNDRGAS